MALPEPEYKVLVPVLLTPYLFCCLNSNKKWNKYVYVSLEVEDPSLNLEIKWNFGNIPLFVKSTPSKINKKL